MTDNANRSRFALTPQERRREKIAQIARGVTRVVVYKRAGAGMEPSIAYFDPRMIPDIAALLTERLGPLVAVIVLDAGTGAALEEKIAAAGPSWLDRPGATPYNLTRQERAAAAAIPIIAAAYLQPTDAP
jgi:hypothetical protein